MTTEKNNLVKVWSPKGELFELSKPNARDLVSHCGFTYTQPIVIVQEAAPAPAPAPAETTPPVCPAPAPTETPAETPAEEPKVRLTEEDFADLEDKAAVRAYIEATFPGTEVDGRSNREKLIALAIELATAE